MSFYIQKANAQLNPLGAQYYSNEYLINPAYAGKSKGLKLNAAYRRLWSGIPGAPVTQNMTGDYGFNRVGIGLNINNEKAGLLRQTRAVGTYAYHLPLDSGSKKLHFGISIGMLTQGFDNSNLNGNPNDIAIGEYNGRQSYIDGDFGIGYTSNRFNIQAAIPNLKDFLDRDQANVADVATFYSAISYRFDLKGGMEIEPKLAYRGVKNYDNLLDIGAQFAMANRKLLISGLYHSNESATFGVGLDFLQRYLISGLYTTQTSALNTYANGSFELNLRINLEK